MKHQWRLCTIQELCVVAKNERKVLADLRRQQQYSMLSTQPKKTQLKHVKTNPDPLRRRASGKAEPSGK